MKKFIPFLIIFIAIILYLFSYRANYLHPYEPRYSRNLFDNSQWRIPESKRGIGDELLYQVSSYELVNTWRYFEINPEVPPLGKYFYGVSLLLFGNAFWSNVPVFLFSVWVFYLLAKEIFKKEWQRNLAHFLFITQPVLFSQLNTTMFDLPQLLALLIHTLAISKLLNSPKHQVLFTLLAGVSAGAFVSLKIGYLILFIFLVDGFFLLRQKKWQSFVVILAAATLIYPLTYLPYFLQGNSLRDFLKSQLWILHFYADSKVPVDRLLMPVTFFTGWYRGWSENAIWTRSDHWSLTWPVFVFLIILSFLRNRRFPKLQLNSPLVYISFLFIAMMFAYWLIPFWTRYLVLTVPLLILMVINHLKKPFSLGAISLIIISLVQLPFSLINRPQPIADHLVNLWREGSYLDLYTYLDLPQTESKRFAFGKKIERLETNRKVEKREINFELGKYNILSTKIPITMQIKYKVPNKLYSIGATSYLVRRENQWRLEWKKKLNLPK